MHWRVCLAYLAVMHPAILHIVDGSAHADDQITLPQSHLPQAYVVDFDNDIIPVLTKAGCNTGACHGAAVGRGGFRLSLYGGDPVLDYQSIVFDLEGRRVNLAKPDESLIVLKPTETISHGGGYRLEDDGLGAQRLRNWVRQGATNQTSKQIREFTIAPRRQTLQSLESSVALTSTASFSDGSQVDVTQWTVFTAEDPGSVFIDPETAVATVLRRGRHIVIARYLSHVVPIELLVPWSDEEVSFAVQARRNFIDDFVVDRLAQLRIPVSPPATDETFLRRVCLDLTGQLPAMETVREFAASDHPSKREDLVHRLLQSTEFTDYWTMQLAKLLRIRSHPDGREGMLAYQAWLKQCVADGTSYDDMVTTLLMASGDTHAVGPANFYRTVAGAREQTEFVSELLMGSRLRCANCHNHPLDRWTQDDYHGLAAIFAKVQSGRVVSITPRGEVTHPRTGEPAKPRIPGEAFLDGEGDQRAALAAWVTDPSNPYFAKAIVNRLWKAMMGRGLVEPADDFRSTNLATHPELLDQLTKDFIDHGYQIRHTLQTIATSSTYSRGAQVDENEFDDSFYSHALSRPLPPEVLADAISDVVGLHERFGDEPVGTRAVMLVDSKTKSETLDVLGRCSREESCEASDNSTGGLTRMLHLINGPLLNQRISAADNRLSQLIAIGASTDDMVAEFYQLALSRKPSHAEQQYWSAAFEKSNPKESRKLLEDFVWGLLNSQEFITNH